MMCKKIFILSFIILLTTINIEAQTCGFGCFGLGGFYAGYGFENYKADGLNNLIESISADPNSSLHFQTSKGFRLGANIFRTKYKQFLFTVKGYYQFLKEEKNVVESADQENNSMLYTLNLNYWGVGFDIGHTLISFIDFKIIDAELTFHTADLSRQLNTGGNSAPEDQFDEKKLAIGYSIGSGFVFRLVEDYISLEATGGYNNFSIGEMVSESGDILTQAKTNQPIEKFVSSGGFFGVVQLNVGIPLY